MQLSVVVCRFPLQPNTCVSDAHLISCREKKLIFKIKKTFAGTHEGENLLFKCQPWAVYENPSMLRCAFPVAASPTWLQILMLFPLQRRNNVSHHPSMQLKVSFTLRSQGSVDRAFILHYFPDASSEKKRVIPSSPYSRLFCRYRLKGWSGIRLRNKNIASLEVIEQKEGGWEHELPAFLSEVWHSQRL